MLQQRGSLFCMQVLVVFSCYNNAVHPVICKYRYLTHVTTTLLTLLYVNNDILLISPSSGLGELRRIFLSCLCLWFYCSRHFVCLSDLSILSVPDEGYSRKVSCALHMIYTFYYDNATHSVICKYRYLTHVTTKLLTLLNVSIGILFILQQCCSH